MKQSLFALFLLSMLAVACSTSKHVADPDVDMIIDMQRMLPVRSTWEELEPAYRLEIHGNEVISYLPYVWGSSLNKEIRMNYLNFTVLLRGFTHEVNKHGHHVYRFNVQHSAYTFFFNVTVNQRGTALVEISSDGCDPISFEGRVR